MVIELNVVLSFLIIFLASFFLTFKVVPVLIRKMSARGLVGKDMNKLGEKKVAELGGIAIMLGFSFGVLIAIFISTYFNFLSLDFTLLFASFLTIFLVGFIGVIDDLIGWKKGIRQYQHALFPLFAALPLMAVQAGTHSLILPFIGSVNIGIWYSLILVPLAITGASNAFNMLAGYNGLEAGLGIIIISTLSVIAFMTGYTEAVVIGVAIISALIAFLFFNWFPAKIFGGDSLTLMIGAGIATMSIIGNMEKIGLLLITLYWIELVFKARKNFQSECFGIPQENGFLKAPKELGSLIHVFLRRRNFTEKGIVKTLLLIQLLISISVFCMFSFALF